MYQIDGSGRFSTGEWIQADDDDLALAATFRASRPRACEVWQGKRLVGRISGGSAPDGD
jgi:Leu/Phe-tRNA-protein transferase